MGENRSRRFQIEIQLNIMTTSRLEAFSDGVLAIILTIMVLELKVPMGDGLASLKPFVPKLLHYVLSFIYVGIYWNNHHHLFQAIEKVNGKVLWANLHLLFWLSLLPVVTVWMTEHAHSKWPVAVYGVILLMSSISFMLIEKFSLKIDNQPDVISKFLSSQRKEKISILLYLVAIGISFFIPEIGIGIFILVAILWFIHDKRIERELQKLD